MIHRRRCLRVRFRDSYRLQTKVEYSCSSRWIVELPILPTGPKKALQSVLVKPTGADCNLDCAYCFYLEKSGLYPENAQHRMSLEVLEAMVRQVMQTGLPSVSFGWQGGEPTLMGLEFFRKAVGFQQRYGRNGQEVGNGLQTNGLLIDEAWCDFFCEFSFLVGLSLDGPQHIHDHYRRTRGGNPSWSRVVDAARRMSDRGVEVNALVVVNNYSANHGAEIYAFLKELGFEFMQFIPCIERDAHDPSRAASFSVSAEAYGKCLCDWFDCWKADFHQGKATTSIRYFDSVFHTYIRQSPPECTLLQECGNYVVVEHNGDIYACDFFVEPEWKLGNLLEHNLADLLNSPRQTEFGRMKNRLPPECPECPWLTHCRGGCTKDRLRDPTDHGSNHFCNAFKMFFDHADLEFRRLAEEWLEERRKAEEAVYRRQEAYASLHAAIKVGRNDPCPCGSGKKYKKCCGMA